MKYIKDKNQVLKDMLENAVHFGHYTNKWNPKMKEFIWGQRKNVHILDLHKTVEYLDKAVEFLKKEKPENIKGEFIKNIFLNSTMGISYKIGGKI